MTEIEIKEGIEYFRIPGIAAYLELQRRSTEN
jgi:hypothetical protein